MMKWIWFFLKVGVLLIVYVVNANARVTGGPYRCSDAGQDAHVQVTKSDFLLSDLPPVGGVLTTITTSTLSATCVDTGGNYKYYMTTAHYATVAPGGDPTVCVIPEFPGVGMRVYNPNGKPLPCGQSVPGSYTKPSTNTDLLIKDLYRYFTSWSVSYGDQPLADLVVIGEINPGTYWIERAQNLAAFGKYSDGSSRWTAHEQAGYKRIIDSGWVFKVSEGSCSLRPLNETFDLGLLEKEDNAAIQPFSIYLDGCPNKEDVEEFKTKATLSFIPNNAEVTLDGRIGNCDREECAENVFIRLKDWQGNSIIAGEGAGSDYALSNQDFVNPMIPFEFQFDAFIDTEAATGGIIDVSITILLKIK
ncbi:hypothetical protein [Shewanella fidelis]|uniref:hypothetical protein n=1 Tax=Shewanella fidelis TaxID=173509 RepID=UPI0012EC4F3A|nr:hypothetical protein [Shewanella fidelis]